MCTGEIYKTVLFCKVKSNIIWAAYGRLRASNDRTGQQKSKAAAENDEEFCLFRTANGFRQYQFPILLLFLSVLGHERRTVCGQFIDIRPNWQANIRILNGCLICALYGWRQFGDIFLGVGVLELFLWRFFLLFFVRWANFTVWIDIIIEVFVLFYLAISEWMG